MKTLVAVFGLVAFAVIALAGLTFVAASYKLKSEIPVDKYVEVTDMQNFAPVAVDSAMLDGVITYNEYYDIVDEAKKNALVIAKVKLVLLNPVTQQKSKKYSGQEIILEPRGNVIKLEEGEGLLND